MTLLENKCVSNLSSTTQRGVEAKEIEIANTYFDMENTSASTQLQSERSQAGGEGDQQDTGSYFQVVVEKHKSKRSYKRVPVASSPETGAGKDAGLYMLPHPMLFACYKCGAPGGTAEGPTKTLQEGGDHKRCSLTREEGTNALAQNNVQKSKSWNIFGENENTKYNGCGQQIPDRVEVYYFEHGCGEYLRMGGGSRETACERVSRTPARFARIALTEVVACLALLIRVPISSLLIIQRFMLELLRDTLTGCTHNLSDYVFKPALAVSFNAFVHPVLVCITNVFRATRDAVLPLLNLVVDATEPVARIFGAIRLVDVRVHMPPPNRRSDEQK